MNIFSSPQFGIRARRLTALALVLLWGTVQSLALAHTHDVSTVHESCGICAVAQLDDLIPTSVELRVANVTPAYLAIAATPVHCSVAFTGHYAARAPPVSLST